MGKACNASPRDSIRTVTGVEAKSLLRLYAIQCQDMEVSPMR